MKFLSTMITKLRSAEQALVYLANQQHSTQTYWEKRVKIYGRRSVLNLGHSEAAFEAVTEQQTREIFPYLLEQLRGDESVLLDLGCGAGRFTPRLAEITQAKVIGVDPIAALLALAPPAENVEYCLMLDNKIPLADQSVNVIWIALVLGGLEGAILRSLISEIKRVLKSDSLLFLIENTSEKPNVKHWKFRSFEEYQDLFFWVSLNHLHDYFDLNERISIMAGRKIDV